MTIPNKKLLFLTVLFLFGFTAIETSFAIITRDKMMQIAESYKTHEWTANEDNICSEKIVTVGSRQVRIDTPNKDCGSACFNLGWWNVNEINQSVPYKWGGFNTLDSFDNGIEAGVCGGDVYNKTIELSFYGASNSDAVGIDCSGFISRCWDKNAKYSTTSIPATFRELESYSDLKEGDALNKKGHVMLFKEFILDESGDKNLSEKLTVYEASSHDWKVWTRDYKIKKELQDKGYLPYSLFNPTNVVLVIDRSGSMRGEKMNDAKEASKQFVDFMESGDGIGIVSFANNASEADMNYQLTEIDGNKPSTVKTEAKNVIDAISAGNVTSIGAGLQMGQDQLNSYGGEGTKTMILLSDGYENRSPWVSEVLDGIINDKIKVCTIGLGSGANQKLLNEIAGKTGCIYKFAADSSELQFIYKILQAEISREDMLKMEKMTIMSGKTITKVVYIDSSISAATFSISWEGSDVDLILTDPNDNIIDHSTNNSDIEFIEGNTYEFYKIDGPKHGEWKMEIKAIRDIPTDGEEVVLSVSGENAMIFEANLNKPEYSKGEKIKITAFVQDPIMDINDPQYVYGAYMSVKAINPNQNQNIPEFQLYDDGDHGDGGVGDGVYAETFSDTTLSGSYTFTVKASGLTNREGDHFTREKTISTFVSEDVYQGAKELKQEAVEELISTDENPVKNLVESAIKLINKSLEEKYWLDDSRLNSKIMSGVIVFNMEKAAVLKLKAAQKQNSKTEIQAAINNLTEADRILAEVSLWEAREMINNINNFAKKIIAEKSVEKAEKEMSKAENFLSGEEAKAITCYKKAWIFSEMAKKLKD